MVDPGYEPSHFGPESACLTAMSYRKGPGSREPLIPLIPVSCEAIGELVTHLSDFHFFTGLLRDSKIEMSVEVLCEL